ncbi:division/cell wall cluster transcriptional repressor MraZ [Neisseria leonii]|uniref:division/cell wall cluster transcriptional repressor MraZ n=1 Tax=Neisseria leonii TaxID=2995413 RepID=UPI00237BFF77|nr:division/cell wall cluster transcriptional repressor MraZ [Neisseria sp. 3986]MDD9326564.1 division/cell wall cluster transcriptional repressor MraZ [Neisseria sp. 3986]
MFFTSGAQELSIDSKGRLAIPAKLRDVLHRQYTPTLVITIASQNHLLLFPEQVWAGWVPKLLDPTTAQGNPLARRVQNMMLHNAESVDLDGAGRILLPGGLRRQVSFDREVNLVPKGNQLELWDRGVWQRQQAEVLAMDPEVLAAELAGLDLPL